MSLGDERLNKRLGLMVGALAKRPSQSLPKAMKTVAALEATYRFVRNDRVSCEALLAPHIAKTIERCRHAGRLVAAIDTTELLFTGAREELGHLRGDKGRGFLAHLALAVELGQEGTDPLGVVHLETMVRLGEAKRQRKGRRDGKEPESLRWDRSADAVYEKLPQAICVMDREADIFALTSTMLARGQAFVVRAAQNRCTEAGLLWERLSDAKLFTTREVALEDRPRRRGGAASKRFAARSAHTAKLELRACTVSLRSPDSTRDGLNKKRAAEVAINLVHVMERDPPEGDPPMEWVLLTSLPIKNAEDVALVVDAYRARWTIEEYFKALKSGCAMEKRQLESVKAMTNMLAISVPIAWLILRLRHLGHSAPDRPGRDLLPPLMLACLRVLYQKSRTKTLPYSPTCQELTWAIAALGGHIPNNGPPGLMVLGRGLEDLIQATDLLEALQGVQDVINP